MIWVWLFSDNAKMEILRRTGGIARAVRSLCCRAILGGAIEQKQVIDTGDIPGGARQSRPINFLTMPLELPSVSQGRFRLTRFGIQTWQGVETLAGAEHYTRVDG